MHPQHNRRKPIRQQGFPPVASAFSAEEVPLKRRPRRDKCNCIGGSSCPARRRIDWILVPLKEAKRGKRWRDARRGRAPDLKQRLIHAFGARCQYCGEYGDIEGIPSGIKGHVYYWTADRIDPVGNYDPANVTLACNSCNGRKGKRLPDFPVPSLAMMEAGQ